MPVPRTPIRIAGRLLRRRLVVVLGAGAGRRLLPGLRLDGLVRSLRRRLLLRFGPPQARPATGIEEMQLRRVEPEFRALALADTGLPGHARDGHARAPARRLRDARVARELGELVGADLAALEGEVDIDLGAHRFQHLDRGLELEAGRVVLGREARVLEVLGPDADDDVARMRDLAGNRD